MNSFSNYPFQMEDGFIFVNKVTGVSTHSQDTGLFGLVEILAAQSGLDLKTVHRLDQETSGAMIFAIGKEKASQLAQLFAEHSVQKTYLFLTDHPHSESQFEVRSYIEKKEEHFVSEASNSPNAVTQFQFVEKVGDHFLWKALPLTGKPHQIRLHAQDKGIPILGDALHGGTNSFRMFLHSWKIEFKLNTLVYDLQTELPWWSRSPLEEFSFINEALSQRRTMFTSIDAKNCFRIVHSESSEFALDQFGSQWWMYWYQSSPPPDRLIQKLEQLAKEHQVSLFIREMKNRGAIPTASALWSFGFPQARWLAQENNVNYQFRSDTGLSPGLFLDQRENRLWVRRHSDGKKILNLFAYTAGFSVNAALGRAKEVVTVDVSKSFLDWSKENFKLNNLDPQNFEFWQQDSILFLQGARKRLREFDVIICDPPSLGRSKDSTFSFAQDWKKLIDLCWDLLATDGVLLFSTNYEKWDAKNFRQKIREHAQDSRWNFKIETTPPPTLDFDRGKEMVMKTILLRKHK